MTTFEQIFTYFLFLGIPAGYTIWGFTLLQKNITTAASDLHHGPRLVISGSTTLLALVWVAVILALTDNEGLNNLQWMDKVGIAAATCSVIQLTCMSLQVWINNNVLVLIGVVTGAIVVLLNTTASALSQICG